eukprot:TRINITY_DN58818_c0_g1_i8.p1 TRINITY_DN58818_c0_g1~~TRINITY_DN58818_c0_g1_i8.p1  ORF type:complete len:529 (-),score=75.73 TRINITY_DN58818_c0_g1_i8:338-1924(-)
MSLVLLFLLTTLFGSVIGGSVRPCFCDDRPPPESELECWEQKELDKCGEDWMDGYCECTCGKCDDLEFDGCVCSDTPPVDSPLTCYEQSILGKCGEEWMGDSCGCSCGKCGDPDFTSPTQECSCGDIPPPESSVDCWVQKEIGQCEESWMSGFCMCSCGTCDVQFSQEEADFINKSVSYTTLSPVSVEPLPTFTQDVPPGEKKSIDFVLIHFNDIHARVEPAMENWWPCNDEIDKEGACYGGLARMKTVIENARRDNKFVLVLDAGDDWIGTSWNYYFDANRAVAFFLNQLYIDAMTLGNHEFDFGPDALADYVEDVNFPVLSCNMEANGHTRLGNTVKKYVVKQIDGVNVGILGVTTEYTNVAKAANPEPVYFTDYMTAVRQCAQELKSQGVEIIIALTHLGYGADKWLASQIAHVDIDVGGHSHSFLHNDGGNAPLMNKETGLKDTPEGNYPTWVDSEVQPGHRVIVLQAGWATRYIGKVDVGFDKHGELQYARGTPILLGGHLSESQISKHEETALEVNKWKYWE